MKWKQSNPNLLGGIPIPLPKCVSTHPIPINTTHTFDYAPLKSQDISMMEPQSPTKTLFLLFGLAPTVHNTFPFPSNLASSVCGGRQLSFGRLFSVEKEIVASCFFLSDLVCWPLVVLIKIEKKKQCGTNRPTFSLVVFLGLSPKRHPSPSHNLRHQTNKLYH